MEQPIEKLIDTKAVLDFLGTASQWRVASPQFGISNLDLKIIGADTQCAL